MGMYTKMRTFVTVIQENSFNQAANKLNTSAAEISRRISALETELKAKLINRTTRKLTLTSLGEIYYEDCKKVLIEVDLANQRILSQQQEPSGILSVHYIASEDILPILPEFTRQYPKVILKLQKSESLPDFKRQELDVMVGLSEDAPLPENCVRKKISKTRYILCCSPEYLSASKPIKKPIDLNGHLYITHIGRLSQEDTVFFKNDLTIHIKPYLYMNDSEEMIKAALSHLGLVWVHEYRAHELLKSKRLVEVLPEYALPSLNRYIIYQYDRYLERKIRVFLDFF